MRGPLITFQDWDDNFSKNRIKSKIEISMYVTSCRYACLVLFYVFVFVRAILKLTCLHCLQHFFL